jgi:hypothetical protein
VEERKFTDIRLAKEHVAEFRYRPGSCDRDYRVVVVWKDLEFHKGQRKLFDDARCFFYITNDFRKSAEAIALPEGGRAAEERRAEKYKLLRMEFTTFRRAFMAVPAQIISTGRRIVFRLLSWNPWQHVFFRLRDQLRTPLRC